MQRSRVSINVRIKTDATEGELLECEPGYSTALIGIDELIDKLFNT